MSDNGSPSALQVFRAPWPFWALLAVALVGASLPFTGGLQNMVQAWLTQDEFSYGLLLPAVSVFLIWQQRDRLERVGFTGSWLGVAVTVLGIAIAFAGKFGTLYVLIHGGVLLTLCGIVLAAMGVAAFRIVAIPLLLMFLAIPVPDFLLNSLSLRLQLISSELGVAIIRLFGISVHLEGNIIDLGPYQLEVAEACDGLRYLFPLMTLGVVMAYFFKAALWKRVLVFVSSVPLTILMNSLRIGAIGVMVEHWGVSMAEGFVHEFQGWLVFMMSAVLLLGLMMLLARVGPEGKPWREVFGLEFPAPTPARAQVASRPIPRQLAVAAVIAVAAAVAALALPDREPIVPARTPFVAYPTNFDGWTGRPAPLDSVYVDALKFDDYLLADYVRLPGGAANLYVAWYDSQTAGASTHSPRSCLPGGGWEIREFSQISVPEVMLNGQPLRANRALIGLGDQQQLVYYWFQQRGRDLTNEYQVKWYLMVDSILRNRTDGALVRLVTPVRGGDVANADRLLTEFAASAVPRLDPFLPD